LLSQSAFNDTYEFEGGALTMVGLTLSGAAAFIGKSVKETARIFPEIHFMPIAMRRKGTQDTIIPRGDTVFREGDQVYFVTTKGGVNNLYKLTGKVRQEIKNVMILGGSKIGRKTTHDLAREKINVKLIESDKQTAYDLADELPKALIIHGDGRNVELLEEENLQDMDAFIAVSGNSETNIALVENMDYFQLSHSIGIDTLVNKKLLAASNIFRYIRKGEVVAMTRLNNMDAELLEFIVKPSSKVCNRKIVDLNFPRSAIIGGIIRNGEGEIALGDYTIMAGDRAVICCLPHAINKVEKMFL
jgi:trk system potassium uptake protein TrkA